MSEEYRIVTVIIRGVRPKAIFIEAPRRAGDLSIPRSLIHAADDARLDGLFSGEEITIRLMAWKAEELGLA